MTDDDFCPYCYGPPIGQPGHHADCAHARAAASNLYPDDYEDTDE